MILPRTMTPGSKPGRMRCCIDDDTVGAQYIAPLHKMKTNYFPRLLLWLAPLTFLGVLFFYPFFRILAFGLNIETFKTDNLQLAFSVLGFTFYEAILSTILTLIVGLPSAYLFAHFDFRGKSLLRAL